MSASSHLHLPLCRCRPFIEHQHSAVAGCVAVLFVGYLFLALGSWTSGSEQLYTGGGQTGWSCGKWTFCLCQSQHHAGASGTLAPRTIHSRVVYLCSSHLSSLLWLASDCLSWDFVFSALHISVPGSMYASRAFGVLALVFGGRHRCAGVARRYTVAGAVRRGATAKARVAALHLRSALGVRCMRAHHPMLDARIPHADWRAGGRSLQLRDGTLGDRIHHENVLAHCIRWYSGTHAAGGERGVLN
jgi:hypothetical protein